MKAVLPALIVSGWVVVFTLLFAGIAWFFDRGDRQPKTTKRDRRKLRQHEDLLDELDKLAIENRDIDPFAEIVHQKIRAHFTEPTRKSPR